MDIQQNLIVFKVRGALLFNSSSREFWLASKDQFLFRGSKAAILSMKNTSSESRFKNNFPVFNERRILEEN
jgi:hypothetical protein